MATTLQTFDAGTPSANVSAGVNGIDAIAGTPVYITGLHGAAAIRTGGSANTTDTSVRVLLGMTGDHAGSVYVKYNTDHGSATASVNFIGLVGASNSFVAEFRCGATNEFGVRVTGTNLFTGAANSVPLNAWFRVDWILTGTSLQIRVYYNPDADSTDTPDISTTITAGAVTAAAVFLKATSSNSIIKDFSFDTLRVSSVLAWFDHFDPAGDNDANVTVWNGTAEVAAAITVWNGTTEVATTLEYNP